ncbi:MAG: TonB-dependent receptor [Chitinophagales bacterium]|nr:TonB-dependent receptor [Chitinophagales bacterium]
MKTRILFFVGLWVLFPLSNVWSNVTMSGQILSVEGIEIQGASIRLESTKKVAYSDVNGYYEIKDIREGKYIVVVQAFTYETLSDSIEIKSEPIAKDFRLKPTLFITDEIIVEGIKAQSSTPGTFTDLDKETIQKQNYGQDLTILLNQTPSMVTSSDAGAGIGYTQMKIRGIDNTRTNVTINGIPLNNPESHETYLVNLPDLASSVNNLQIQRGVGTSTNGAAAFGASVNIQTNEYQPEAYAEISSTYGSYNTWKNTLTAGTGLLGKFSADVRLSKISSDGYIDRASSDLKSLAVNASYYGKKTSVRVNIFSGKEVTYQAWNGAPESVAKQNIQGIHEYIERNGISGEDAKRLLESGRTYNEYTYKNQVDNYMQNHYQLHISHQFNNQWNAQLSLHYTKGKGYYEEYKTDDEFANYNLPPAVIVHDTVYSSDIIRRRQMDNDFFGAVYAVNYKNKNLNFTYGGGLNKYLGNHFGNIIWARVATQMVDNERYYFNSGIKSEINNYAKLNYTLNKTRLFIDLQYRYLHYALSGEKVQYNNFFSVDRIVNYHFFNPKMGVNQQINDRQKVYLTYGISNREPVRSDFTDGTVTQTPLPERMHDIELGYVFKTNKAYLNATYYMMYYQNQLILDGKINDNGDYNRTNVKKSYRMGVELEVGVSLTKQLQLNGNVSISRNKIPVFTEYIDDYDQGGQISFVHKNSNIALSPSVVSSAVITYEPVKDFQLSLISKFVGKQYLDNTSDNKRALDRYSTLDFSIRYTLRQKFFEEMKFGLLVNNITYKKYSANGYTYSYFSGGQAITENFLFPQALTNFLLNVTMRL